MVAKVMTIAPPGRSYAQGSSELRVERADRLLLVVGAVNAPDGVNLCFRKRTIAQVHGGQAEVARWPLTYGHGLVKATQQNDEWIVGPMFVIGHHPHRG